MGPTLAALLAAAMLSHRVLSIAAASAVAFSVPGFAEPVAVDALGPSAFTAPGAFPTSVYKHYYNSPTATSAQPQPVISDPVSVGTIPVSTFLRACAHPLSALSAQDLSV